MNTESSVIKYNRAKLKIQAAKNYSEKDNEHDRGREFINTNHF